MLVQTYLDQIDWKVMKAKYWHDRPEDLDRKRRRQAEFLVHHFCPWACLLGVAAIDEAVRQRVLGILKEQETAGYTNVRPDWYY